MKYPLLQAQRQTAYAFFLVTSMVFIMIVIGGLTRLTGSGLSIVEWKPIMGFLPPFTAADWQVLFSQYQGSPEFHQVNWDMDLEGFKRIFWLEFIHRFWGRLIGIALLIPTFLTLKEPHIRKEYSLSIAVLWILGAAQGFLGWYMVKSGLIKDPHVSPYRLTAHLLMAFMIIGISLQAGLNLLNGKGASPRKFNKRMKMILSLVLLTVCFGGLVAGHKAGLIYNTFPKMDTGWLPDSMWLMTPLWRNITENAGTVQFIHRILATLTFLALLFITRCLFKQRDRGIRRLSQWVLLIGAGQFTLGVSTLLLHTPLSLAALHQTAALLLFIGLIQLNHRLRQAHIR